MYSEDLSAAVSPYKHPRGYADVQNTWEDPMLVTPQVKTPQVEKWESYEVKKHSWAFFVFDGQ